MIGKIWIPYKLLSDKYLVDVIWTVTEINWATVIQLNLSLYMENNILDLTHSMETLSKEQNQATSYVQRCNDWIDKWSNIICDKQRISSREVWQLSAECEWIWSNTRSLKETKYLERLPSFPPKNRNRYSVFLERMIFPFAKNGSVFDVNHFKWRTDYPKFMLMVIAYNHLVDRTHFTSVVYWSLWIKETHKAFDFGTSDYWCNTQQNVF